MPADRFIHPRLGHSRKVSSLCDFDYRIWTQYLLSADDFGVMRASAVTLQADSDALEARTPKAVERGLEHVINKGLVIAFDHQGRRYVFQHDWQKWQKVEYPRTTNSPKPPPDSLALCDPATRELFGKHPGGQGKKKPDKSQESPEGSPSVPQMNAESSPPTRAGAPAKRLTANGERLVADGSEEGPGETTDVLAMRLLDVYPKQGICSIHDATVALRGVLHGKSPGEFDALLARLETHKQSARWLEQGGKFIPRLDNYLTKGTHTQQMAAAGTVASSSKTSGNIEAARRFIERGEVA